MIEITRSTGIPISAAFRSLKLTARIARPNFVLKTKRSSPSMSSTAVPPATRSTGQILTPASVASGSVLGISVGMRSGRVPNIQLSCPRFCSSRLTPIAVISTFSRGADRSGLYARRSSVNPTSPHASIAAIRITPPDTADSGPLRSTPASITSATIPHPHTAAIIRGESSSTRHRSPQGPPILAASYPPRASAAPVNATSPHTTHAAIGAACTPAVARS